MTKPRESTHDSSHAGEVSKGNKRSRKDFEELEHRRELQDLEHCEKEGRKFEYDNIDDDQYGRDYIRPLILEPIPQHADTKSARKIK